MINTFRQAEQLGRVFILMCLVMLLAACDFEVEVVGGGMVKSQPKGIKCRENSGTCLIENYENLGDGNDEVTTVLRAIPDPGWKLSHWEGCDDTYRLKCDKYMEGDIYIKAVFEPLDYATDTPNAGNIRFVALGDFGEGNAAQKMVGDAMASVCSTAGGCDFAIGLGDNIYEENPTEPYSDVFERKFEYPFINVDFPFYMSLGNHDNDLVVDGVGSFNMVGDVQVQYSYRQDRMSDKWIMPARYYKHSHPQGAVNPLAEFYALDSNPFISPLEINPEYWTILYGTQQGDWVGDAIDSSNASWKIAYGHHPFISNGTHGNAGNYDGLIPLELITYRLSGEDYRKWLTKNVCGKVDFYVAGHDHDLQVLHSLPECGDTILMVSGAAAKLRDPGDKKSNPAIFQVYQELGFMMVELVGNMATVKVYTVNPDNGAPSLSHQSTFQRRDI